MAVRKLRAGVRSGVLGGIAMLGAGVMLSACSPVQMGAAAIVGNQRISQSTLSANVTDLQSAITAAKVPARQMQLSTTQMPRGVLGNLIQFAIMNQVARKTGVSVTPTQVSDGTRLFQSALLQGIEQSVQQQAQQEGARLTPRQAQDIANKQLAVAELNEGIWPKLLPAVGRFVAEKNAIAAKLNHGKIPSTQAEQAKASAELDRLQSEIALKINPQYGKFDATQGGIVAAPDTLSRPASGAAAAAPAAS